MQGPASIYEDQNSYTLKYRVFVAQSDAVSWAQAREGVPAAISNLVTGYPDNILSVPNYPAATKAQIEINNLSGYYADIGGANFVFLNFKTSLFGAAGGTTGIYIDGVQNLSGFNNDKAQLYVSSVPNVIDFSLCAVALSCDPATNFGMLPFVDGRIRSSISVTVRLIK